MNVRMKKILTFGVVLLAALTTFAQKTDTVVVALAKTSRMVFTIKDKSDLEQLRQYDFQAMFDDILNRLEKNDSVVVVVNPAEKTETESAIVTESDVVTYTGDDNDRDNDDDDDYFRHKYRYRTRHAFNVDLGLSSYLEDGKFPDEAGKAYAIRPWGSWHLGLNSVQRTAVTNSFYVEWALGVSWNIFAFQNDNTLVVKEDDGVAFEEDFRDVSFIKSKFGVTYLNVSAVPMFSFGDERGGRKWRTYNSGFRIGVGPYAGYRIGSWARQVYKDEDGDRQRERTRDNFYLNNFRYGVRLQVGVRSADFFINYDMNDLFASGKGPTLNALSFGVTF